ncbi:hypothetical protein NFI96_028919, partial [Prochilodus magdalenae]
MAEASISVDQDQFSCPVCLDLLKDPVAIPCGHSFCMECINGCWDQEDQRGLYSCPQCRQTFTPRPVLRRNNMLAEVVEKLKKTELQAAPPAHCYTGPGDVECDFCTGRKHKAIKSCLVCLVSLCETHLKPHLQLPALGNHKLVKASTRLQEKICSQHDKLIEIYCRTDQSCICYLCMLDQHNGHRTVSAAAERTERQSQVKELQRTSQQRIQEKEEKLQELKQAVDTLKSSAQTAVEDSERIFTELICSIEKKRSEVTELIRAQEKTELSRAEGLIEQLEQEIADLKRRDTELEQLEHTEDHIQFLQSFQSLCVSTGSEDSPNITVRQHLSFDKVSRSLSDLKKQLEEFWEEKFSRISPHAAAVQILLSEPTTREDFLHSAAVQISPSEPTTREDFLHYYCQLTLDPNTAYKYLILSEENRVVRRSWNILLYSDHPERFKGYPQVLSKESVSGRCYWEVEWTGGVYISVSYKGIRRKGTGNKCRFGGNRQSWSLRCSSSLSFYHNNIETEISAPSSSRIGVTVTQEHFPPVSVRVIPAPEHNNSPLVFKDPPSRINTYSEPREDVLLCGVMLYADQDTYKDRHCGCHTRFRMFSQTPYDKLAPARVKRIGIHMDSCAESFEVVDGVEDQRGVYSCPQCRETFTPRPVLRRNNMLAEVVEKLKKTELQAAPPAHCYAGPGDVQCDFCTGRKHKAIKSCLTCLASFCETHLKPHYEVPSWKNHKLVKASTRLQEKICSQHDKLIEIYCRTDQRCICYMCTMHEHRGHDTVAAAAERTERQSQLKELQRKSQQRIQEKKEKLQELKQAVDTLKSSAQTAVEDSERIFTELICSIEKKRSEVTELIRAQEKTELSRAEGLIKQLEQEIADLKRRDTELEQLEHTEDHIQFLQSLQSLCVSTGPDDSLNITVQQHLSVDKVRRSLSDLKKLLEEFWKKKFSRISPQAEAVHILFSEPKTREDFLQYYCQLTLDPNTARRYLILSEKNRVVRCSQNANPYSDHPERFDSWYQVLCKESLSGRCYWEVAWSSLNW